jgi:acyl-coenzyme A thioesterase PaaI-like protein
MRSGALRSNGRAVRVGTRIAYAEADVADAEGRLVARATGSYLVASRVRLSDTEGPHPAGA